MKYLILDSDNNVIDTAGDMEGAKIKAHNMMLDVFENSANELFAQYDNLRQELQELERNIQAHRRPFKIILEAEVNPNDYSTDS